MRSARPSLVVGVAVLSSVGVGVGIVAIAASGALEGKVLPVLLLSVCVVGSLWAVRSPTLRRAAGPGVFLACAALGTAFVLGLSSGDIRVIEEESRVAAYFAVGVAAILAGAMVHAGFQTRPAVPRARTSVPFKSNLLLWLAAAFLGLAALNMLTGTVPLLAGNVDQARFTGSGGVVSPIFVFVIGGLQWVLLICAVTWLVRREPPAGLQAGVLLAAAFLLFLLAARSFFVSVGLATIVAGLLLGRINVRALFIIATAGLVVLAIAGQARNAGSDPTGENRQALEQQGYGGLRGTIVLSSTTGPWVLGQTLERVPNSVPHQRGQFALRDLKAQTPLQPFGAVERSDLWVTHEILDRDTDYGMPPTLVGGLFIDFGFPGILVGCLLVGYVLAALFRWAGGAGTVGAISLYGYVSGYVALSSYSYLSVKPLTLTVIGLCFVAHRVELRMNRVPDRIVDRRTDSRAPQEQLKGWAV